MYCLHFTSFLQPLTSGWARTTERNQSLIVGLLVQDIVAYQTMRDLFDFQHFSKNLSLINNKSICYRNPGPIV